MSHLAAYVSGIQGSLARRPWLGWLLRGGGTALALLWLFRYVDLAELRRVSVAPEWLPLIGMVLTAWLFIFVGALKFWVLFRALAPIPLSTFLGYFLIATALGTFTPASLGDFSLAAFLRRNDIPTHESISVMMIDRLVTVAIYGAIFLPLTLASLLDNGQFWWIVLLFWGGTVTLLALNYLPSARQLAARVVGWARWPFLSDLARSFSALLRQHPWHLLGNIALTLLRCVVAAIVVQLAFWAAGLHEPFQPVLYATNSISLLNLLPVSLAGLGVYEGGGVALFSQFGFDRERVFAGLIYQRVYVIVYSLLLLLLSRFILRWFTNDSQEEAP